MDNVIPGDARITSFRAKRGNLNIKVETMKFKIDSQYKPSGDQPAAIEGICSALNQGVDAVTLLGVTGS